MSDLLRLPAEDIERLRRLGARKAEIANDPVNLERKEAWYRLDQGAGHRPMVLAEVCGIRDENRALTDAPVQCKHPFARGLEWGLLAEIYQFEVLKDDHVVEPFVQVNWKVKTTDYGVKKVDHHSDGALMGARSWEPALHNLGADLKLLRPRTYSVDRAATDAERECLQSVFGGILDVRLRGSFWWTMGLTIVAIDLIGLENLMLYMFDNPEGLHKLMAFLRDDHLAYAHWLESEGLLNLNNENDYIGSGSMGYTRRLAARGPNGKVRLKDQWLLLESQETVGVGPVQFEEFIFPYQAAIASEFGLVYYGCCEPLHTRFDVVRRLPNLARASVSPWAKEEAMAAALGPDRVFSRKPNPTLISTENFDETAIRADLRRTLAATPGNRLEIIMKDVHTLNNQPDRLPRWVQLAREEIAAARR